MSQKNEMEQEKEEEGKKSVTITQGWQRAQIENDKKNFNDHQRVTQNRYPPTKFVENIEP
jgi:hypothetical protein